MTTHGRDGDAYVVTPAQIEAFQRDGYVHIPGVLSESEMLEIEEPVMKFLRGEVVPNLRNRLFYYFTFHFWR